MRTNRDYFRTPVQSDRTSFGYGHTDLDNELEPRPWYVRYETLLTCVVVLVTVFAITLGSIRS